MKALNLGLVLFVALVLCTVGVSAQLSQINMSTPLNNTHVRGTILLSVNGSRGTNFTNVTWAFVNATGHVRVVNTTFNDTVNSTFDGTFAFYGKMFDTTVIPDNRYNITANATNGSGSTAINSTLATYQGAGYNITIDNNAPNATLLSPFRNGSGTSGNANVTPNGDIPIFGNGNTTYNFSFVAEDNVSTNFINVFLVIDGNSNGTRGINLGGQLNVTALRYVSNNFSVNISALSEGSHSWTLNLLDEAGNNASAYPNVSTNNFTVDRSPPVFDIYNKTYFPPAGFHVRGLTGNNTFVNFTFLVTDRFISSNMSAYIVVDSAPINQTQGITVKGIGNNTNVTLNQTFSSGIHYWNITTNDTWANNSNISNTYNFTVDSGAPNVTLFFPSEGLVFSQGRIIFNWSVTDDFDSNLSSNLLINDVINISDIPTANGTTTTASMFFDVTGSYNWTINVTDEAGNRNKSITINFTVRIPTGGSGSGGSGGTSRVSRRGLPAGGLLLTVYTTGRVSVDIGGTYQVLDLIRTNNNELADITFGSARATLKQGVPTALDVNGDNKYDVTLTPIKVFPKRVDLRVTPSGQAAPGAAVLPSHIVPKRPALTGSVARPKSTPKTGMSAGSTAAGSTGSSRSSGLGAVSGRAVDEAPEAAAEAAPAAAGGFSVVMLIVSLLVLFAVIGLIYYLYAGKGQK